MTFCAPEGQKILSKYWDLTAKLKCKLLSESWKACVGKLKFYTRIPEELETSNQRQWLRPELFQRKEVDFTLLSLSILSRLPTNQLGSTEIQGGSSFLSFQPVCQSSTDRCRPLPICQVVFIQIDNTTNNHRHNKSKRKISLISSVNPSKFLYPDPISNKPCMVTLAYKFIKCLASCQTQIRVLCIFLFLLYLCLDATFSQRFKYFSNRRPETICEICSSCSPCLSSIHFVHDSSCFPIRIELGMLFMETPFTEKNIFEGISTNIK